MRDYYKETMVSLGTARNLIYNSSLLLKELECNNPTLDQLDEIQIIIDDLEWQLKAIGSDIRYQKKKRMP